MKNLSLCYVFIKNLFWTREYLPKNTVIFDCYRNVSAFQIFFKPGQSIGFELQIEMIRAEAAPLVLPAEMELSFRKHLFLVISSMSKHAKCLKNSCRILEYADIGERGHCKGTKMCDNNSVNGGSLI